MRVVPGRPSSFLCCGRCAHSMARARRQPDARSEILSDPSMDALGRGRCAARAFDTRSRHDAIWWCKAQVEFNGALGYKALRRS